MSPRAGDSGLPAGAGSPRSAASRPSRARSSATPDTGPSRRRRGGRPRPSGQAAPRRSGRRTRRCGGTPRSPACARRRSSRPPSLSSAARTVVVPRRRRHDRDVRVVLGGRADHRRPADVDLLDQLVERDPRSLQRLRERVQVADDELERRDRRGDQLAPVVGPTAVGEEPGVDPRMERLDPPVEHLREAGHGGDVGDRQAGVAQGPRGAPRSRRARSRGRRGRDRARRGRSCRRRTAARGEGRGRARPRGQVQRHVAPVDGERLGEQRGRPPAAGAGARPPGSGRGASPRRRRAGPRTGSWATIGPPSRVSSTRWTVQPVTGTPWASASPTACAPGNAGRSDGWVLRIRPANAPSTAGPTMRM